MRQFIFSRPFILAFGLSTAFVLVTPTFAQNGGRPNANATAQGRVAAALDLVARDTRSDRAAVSAKSLTIAKLDIKVRIDGGLASTEITARFTNPNNAVLEGDFTLSLPREAWVTGFALDVNGVLVDGVLQPKAKAAEAYEENLRRGVDPGLGEINEANQFRTRIFPINPQSGRTIRITYISTLDATGSFTLPLTSAGAVGEVSVSVSNQGNANPTVRLPSGLTALRPDRNPQTNAAGTGGFYDGYGQTIATFAGANVVLAGDLKLSDLGREDGLGVTSTSGESYFTFIVPAAPVTASKPKIVRLYWDTSRSRRDDDLAKEIALLERYIGQVGPDQLDLILFADGAPRTVSLNRATMGSLSGQLRDIRYQGASRFGDLESAGQGESDVCLVFSDGQLTMDAFGVRTWPCKVMTISTSANARRDVLEGMASANRGTFIDLKTTSIVDALEALQTRGPDLRSLTTASGASVEHAIIPTADGNFRVVGPRPDGEELVLKTYGGERRLSFQSAATSAHDGIRAIWGANQIKRLSATDNPDTDALLAAVRRYGVATPDYSYIVLETVEDYARNNIAPNPSIGKEFLAEYQTRRTQIEAAEQAAKDGRFQTILGQWNEQKTWWKSRFDPRPQTKSAANANDAANQQRETDRVVGNAASAAPLPEPAPMPPPPVMAMRPQMVAPAPPPPPPAMVERRTSPVRAPSAAMQQSESVSVAGARRDRAAGSDNASPQQEQPGNGQSSGGQVAPAPPRSNITVTAATWNPNRPYLNALRDVKSGDDAAFEALYRVQEARFGDTPAFYFDMAEWVYRNGLEGRAAGIARNGLELSNTTIDTKIILASRLVRYGAFTQAIWLNERILQVTPNKPQALRNLALSIIDATDARPTRPNVNEGPAIAAYERALGLLMKIVLTPNNGDYDGIELIALMEANHVVAKLKALGVTDARLATLIDPRLVTLMSVDIRVILEWNTDKTDMDLWVDEPTGERAIFNNPRTAIGGRLSNDMTRGYGPEEYLLNVAPDGLYKVLSNAYAADRLDPNGPTSLTVKLYRDWGRANQQVESFVVELNRGQQNATTEVGRFVKGPARQGAGN